MIINPIYRTPITSNYTRQYYNNKKYYECLNQPQNTANTAENKRENKL